MSNETDIAVIGMAGRYPKADSPEQLWQNLVAGVDMSEGGGTAPDGRIRRHFAVDGIDLFDHGFFGFTPFASQTMDPQHRVLLTCAYQAMEHAGYERIPRGVRVGVFASGSLSTYLINVLLRSPHFDPQDDNYQLLLGNDKDTLATRVAYKLNLTGPALGIQCACSSSLVALHYACQSLLAGDCDICLVGAVSLTVPQDGGYHHKEGGILSRDGYCRAFDKAATGTVKGNGCSVVVLRPLRDAEREGDRVQAVIRGTAVNNDGGEKAGFTAPSVSGQRRVIEEALSFAGVARGDIDYIETHGTGTDLGDQIELTGLAAAFDGPGDKIPLGSLKASIGHLDVAAGITSVIKSVFVLRHGLVPAIANLRDPTDAVEAASARFEFPREASPRTLNLVGVSSFGIGGTNAHAVIARHEPKTAALRRGLPYYLVPISVNRIEDWTAYGANILAQLRSGTPLLDLAATLALRRRRRTLVRCVVVRTAEMLANAFEKPGPPPDSADLLLPRFTSSELEQLATELPCVSLRRDENGASDPLHLAHSVCQVLAGLGVFAIRPLRESNGVAVETHPRDEQDALRHWATLLCRDRDELPEPSTPPTARLLSFLARVHTRFELDLTELYRGTNWMPTSLPAYPLQQVRHWADVGSQPPAEAGESQPATRAVRHDEALLDEILAIWRAGIGEEDISDDTTFAEAGADSLMAIDVIDRVNQTYGCKIGVTAALADLTPQGIVSLILGREFRSSAPWISSVRHRSAQAKNIFLVHPAGGSTFCYSSLGRHVTENVNLCAIDLPEGYEGYGSLTALAERYATAIRSHQPHGPYRVGGYSFGGNLAHELARILEQAGSEVEAVYMFDSHPPEAYNRYDGSELDYVGAFPAMVASYFKPALVESATRESEGVKDWTVAVEIVRRLGILKGSISNDDAERFFRRWVFSHTLLKHHRLPGQVEAPLTLFVAQEDESPLLLEKLKIQSVSKLCWESYYVNPVRAIPVDGDHFTMFGVSRHLKMLAKRFDAALQTREEVEHSLPTAGTQIPA
jgi:3-oxoacyl-(acyl-carrier-protein) synthase/thioesterase domain-containing protein/acyl carrier protein